VIGSQRLAHAVFLSKPFAEIDELAALRAKGAQRFGEEIIFLLADRAVDKGGFGHGILAKYSASF
jgi:hypothetical protein